MKKNDKNMTYPSLAGPIRFREIDGRILVTNDVGDHALLSHEKFKLLISGGITIEDEEFVTLKSMGMVMDGDRLPATLIEKYKNKNLFLFQGPSLFIIVTTLRCNRKCLYCHAGAKGARDTSLDMNIMTARRVIDTIYNAPTINIAIEYQGGEPLLNWETIKAATDYAIDMNNRIGKNLMITLVSNLSLLDDAKLDFLIDRRVSLCTSIDGPAFLQKKHRGDSWKELKTKFDLMTRRYRERFDTFRPAALTTVTKHSLPHHKEIIDTFIELGMNSVHLRPLNPLGSAKGSLTDLYYTPEEFLDFYKSALEYIIQLNKNGTFFVERTAWIFLMKILTPTDPNFVDLRSPCGAGTGQIAFNYNGDVYTCDEGRMLAMQGDESFRMGNVFDNSYNELAGADIVKQLCVASTLEGIPLCSSCAYKPYCGVCPLLNYAEEGNLFSLIPQNRRHIINQSILDFLFKKLQNQEDMKVFANWLEKGIRLA